MRFKYAIVALAAVSLSSVAAFTSGRIELTGASSVRPTLEIAEPVQDLGCTDDDVIWRVPFLVFNNGVDRIVINLETTCPCCDSDPPATTVIPPGSFDCVYVVLDTTGENGLVERTTSFRTSDPRRPQFRVTARVIKK